MLEFQQSETTAERRRWILVLVDSTDGVSGLTGQTGTVYISKNGGTPAASTNSIVEVDATNMPGHYYIELTQGELDTLGFISITKKTAGSLAFHDRALVTYNDPYVSAGGFSGGGGSSGSAKITSKQLDEIAKKVWEYKLGEAGEAQVVMKELAPMITAKVEEVGKAVSGVTLDLAPIISEIQGIAIPEPADYSAEFKGLSGLIGELKTTSHLDTKNLEALVERFKTGMANNLDDIRAIEENVSAITNAFNELKAQVDELASTVSEQSDMDKRFENMTSVMQKKALDKLSEDLKTFKAEILKKVVDTKYDILEELKQ